jgi:hypothetical protein
VSAGPIRVVWLYGAPSAGKTTTGWEIYRSLRLPERGYLDIDQLGMCYPVGADDPHRDRLKAQALGRILANFSAHGARLVIVSGILDPALLPLYQEHAPAAGFTLCRVTAASAELRRRLSARGGDETAALEAMDHAERLDRARHQHVTLDTTVESPAEVAQRVVHVTGLSSLPPATPKIVAAPLVPSDAPGRVMFVIGPGSVGKSTVSWLLFTRAHTLGITGFVDLGQIGFLPPTSEDDPDQHGLKAANLAALWSTFHAWGAHTLIVNGAIPDRDVLRLYQQALPAADIVVVRLCAGPFELARRLMRQVHGHGLSLAGDRPSSWFPEQRRRELRALLAQAEALDRQQLGDAVVDTTTMTAEHVAQQAARAVNWPFPRSREGSESTESR